MATIVISPVGVASAPRVGGHFWVYMQYAHGLQRLGHTVYWLERFEGSGDPSVGNAAALAAFASRMQRFGLGNAFILYSVRPSSGATQLEFRSPLSDPEAVLAKADLLLNFDYRMAGILLSSFRRTAMVDIDPGLLQFWISTGQLVLPKHDRYFTIGETVAGPSHRISDCGLPWIHTRPPICLDLWPYSYTPGAQLFTTVSSWWGGGERGEWITDGADVFFENNKRVTFLEFGELAQRTSQPLELALFLGEGDTKVKSFDNPDGWTPAKPAPSPDEATDYKGDARDRALLEALGWRVRHSSEVADTPERYRDYIQQSRGEFSCAKPSCMYFENSWVSDRTLCYLASGKPAVVQHTGPSSLLTNGHGLLRFSTVEEARDALERVNADYERHSIAAREIARAFDATNVLAQLLASVENIPDDDIAHT